jgi:hypothetical protein
MKKDNENEGRNRFKKFRENHLVHFIMPFAQPHFSQLGRRLKSVVWGKVEAWTKRHRRIFLHIFKYFTEYVVILLKHKMYFYARLNEISQRAYAK